MIGFEFSHRIATLEDAALGARDFDLLVALSPGTRPLRAWRRAVGTVVEQNHPNRRYFRDGWSASEAQAAVDVASEIYEHTIAEDVLDGKLPF